MKIIQGDTGKVYQDEMDRYKKWLNEEGETVEEETVIALAGAEVRAKFENEPYPEGDEVFYNTELFGSLDTKVFLLEKGDRWVNIAAEPLVIDDGQMHRVGIDVSALVYDWLDELDNRLKSFARDVVDDDQIRVITREEGA